MSERKYKNYKSFNSSYIGGWTFEDGDKVLTIRDVVPEMVRNEKTQSQEEKICIYFMETEKPMILNSTNNDTITKVIGSSLFDDWIGKQILIGTEKVRAFGDVWDAVRVRNEKPRAKAKGTPITDDQKQVILDLAQRGAIKMDPMLSYYRVGSLDELSREQAAELIRIKSGKVSE